jgi:hypothetical protein
VALGYVLSTIHTAMKSLVKMHNNRLHRIRFLRSLSCEPWRSGAERKMPLRNLTDTETRIVFECLQAIANTKLISDETFQTLMGVHKNELLQIIKNWDKTDEFEGCTGLAINNSMNNLIHLAPDGHEAWENYISVSRDKVERIYIKWKKK